MGFVSINTFQFGFFRLAFHVPEDLRTCKYPLLLGWYVETLKHQKTR